VKRHVFKLTIDAPDRFSRSDIEILLKRILVLGGYEQAFTEETSQISCGISDVLPRNGEAPLVPLIRSGAKSRTP
jgi:hypothetical protein